MKRYKNCDMSMVINITRFIIVVDYNYLSILTFSDTIQLSHCSM